MKQHKCSKCGQVGHNRRTCGVPSVRQTSPAVSPLLPPRKGDFPPSTVSDIFERTVPTGHDDGDDAEGTLSAEELTVWAELVFPATATVPLDCDNAWGYTQNLKKLLNTIPAGALSAKSFDTVLDKFDRRGRDFALTMLYSHPNFPVAAAGERLARKYGDWSHFLKSQEKNHNLSVEILHEAMLSDPRNHITLCAVARHPNTPVETLVVLSRSKVHSRVRRTVAKNPRTPMRILQHLALSDTTKEVRLVAIEKMWKRGEEPPRP